MAAGQSRPIDRILNILVSAAAVPVLLGALFKITHAPGADTWLKIGLYVEAGIFLGYALLYVFAPPPESHFPSAVVPETQNPALKSMDKMLQEADITPSNLKKLGEGISRLGVTAGGLSDIGDVVKSTSEFGNKTKEATAAITTMSTAFNTSATNMASFNNVSESAKGFHEQVQVLTKNLGSLNTIYELELNESNNHLKALNSFYGKMADASNVMMNSVEDANKARDQIGLLAGNLGKLNAVYGKMADASNVMISSVEDANKAKDQMGLLAGNLGRLNAVYGNMADTSNVMMTSVEDANKAKDQITLLAGNLGKLNAVYGNMLSAMQVKSS